MNFMKFANVPEVHQSKISNQASNVNGKQENGSVNNTNMDDAFESDEDEHCGQLGGKNMRKIFRNFSHGIRGKRRAEFTQQFWDDIIITTMDADQKSAYEVQVSQKIISGELPVDVPFHVIADPPGSKIGNGGSTMHCISELYKIYGNDLYQRRIFLIHAGGMSQRLPSVSVPGKVFLPLPIGKPMFQALEMTICMYLPFVKKMRPGFLVVCSDMLITYELDDAAADCDWTFENDGFTVLGHPSPVFEGEKHGVYVVGEQLSKDQLEATNVTVECINVLQKPSLKRLKEYGAIIKDKDGHDMIYTDSCFFFDSNITKKLKIFYDRYKPLQCEIDAYGDFLPALGSNANDQYIQDTSNVTTVDPQLLEMRKKVYDLLQSTNLTLILLNKSRFYHVGTLYELIHNFCIGSDLIENMGLRKIVDSFIIGPRDDLQGVVMQSIVSSQSIVPFNSVIGYCRFKCPVVVGEYSIISNCSIGITGLNTVPLTLPDNIMLHTIPVFINGTEGFVTVAFGINDDVKKTVALNELDSLSYYGLKFTYVLQASGFRSEDVFTSEKCSLWTAKLFSVQSSMEESFQSTYGFIQTVRQNAINLSPCNKRYSMADILHHKDAKRLVHYRSKLKNLIHLKNNMKY